MGAHAVTKSADLQNKINRLTWTCIKRLEDWSLIQYGMEARKSHLTRLIEEAVELRLRVFGERSGWLMWQWDPNAIEAREGGGPGSFVVFHGLELKQELRHGRATWMGAGECDHNVGSFGPSCVEVILAPTIASL